MVVVVVVVVVIAQCLIRSPHNSTLILALQIAVRPHRTIARLGGYCVPVR